VVYGNQGADGGISELLHDERLVEVTRDGSGGHKKPSGKAGWLGLGPDGIEFQPVELPKTKAALEAAIVRVVTSSQAFKTAQIPWPGVPLQAEENSFDFVFPKAPGSYLELMEIAIFDVSGGFARVPFQRNAYKYVWSIWQKLSEKAMGYGGLAGSKVHLLLYTTDSAFHLLPDEEDALANCLAFVDRGFRSVTYTHASGGSSVLYPRAHPGFLEESLKRLKRVQMLGSDLSTVIKTGPNSGKVEARARRGDPPKSLK